MTYFGLLLPYLEFEAAGAVLSEDVPVYQNPEKNKLSGSSFAKLPYLLNTPLSSFVFRQWCTLGLYCAVASLQFSHDQQQTVLTYLLICRYEEYKSCLVARHQPGNFVLPNGYPSNKIFNLI